MMPHESVEASRTEYARDWLRYQFWAALSWPFWLLAKVGNRAQEQHDRLLWRGERAHDV